MGSHILKRSLVINHHNTSVSLEDQFWHGLKDIAATRQQTVSRLVGSISANHEGNLSSAIRRFVLSYYIDRAANGSVMATDQNREAARPVRNDFLESRLAG